MARMRYVSDSLRTAFRPFAAFLGVLLVIFLLRKLPLTSDLVHSLEARMATWGAGAGRGLTRLVASEDSLSVLLNVCEEDKVLLARDSVDYLELQKENIQLKAALAYKAKAGTEAIAAKIIARSLPEARSRVVIDQGANDGVIVGSTVVVGDGVVYGSVTSVNAESSVVTLLTSSDSKVPAAILGKRKTVGLIEGRDGAVLSMKFIPREYGVARDDVVVSSGLEGSVPENLLLGTVIEVIDMESAPFAEALVEPLQDPLEWSVVLVLTPIKEQL